MADVDQTVAASGKIPTQPDVIGPITSLMQLQYMQANAQRANVESQGLQQQQGFNQATFDAKQNYLTRIQGGEDPASAVVTSGWSALDPTGADAGLKNVQQQRSLSAYQQYAKTNDSTALASQGPAAVQAAQTLQANQNFAATGDPDTLRSAGAEAYKAAQDAIQTHGAIAVQRLGIMGQIGSSVIAGVGPDGAIDSQVRVSAVRNALNAGLITPQQAKEEAQMPDGQLLTVAHSWVAGGMAAKDWADSSGQTDFNKGLANAATYREPLGPGVTLSQGPASYAVTHGQPVPSLSALGNFGSPAAAGPSLSNPSGAPPAAPAPQPVVTAAPNARAAVAPPRTATLPASTSAFANAGIPAFQSASAGNAGGFSPAGIARTVQIESGGNPKAVNGNAAGLAQFEPDTWRKYGQGSPFDPGQAIAATARYSAANAPILAQALGRPPTDAELYLAHQQGGAGAAKLLANPNARAGDLVGDAAIRNNGGNPNAPASAFTNMWVGKFNGPGGSVAPGGGQSMVLPAAAGGPPSTASAALIPAILPSQNAAPAQPKPVLPPPVQPTPSPAAPAPAPAPAAPVVPANATTSAAPAAKPLIPVGSSTPTAAAAATSGLPAGYAPVDQGIGLAEQTKQQEVGKAQGEQFKTAKDAYQSASTAQMKINELQHNLADLPNTGLLAPGAGATERIGMAKYANSLLTAAGAAPMFDPKAVASAEAAQKITGGLGFDMSRTLGAREAAQIVHQAISLNPGVENTPRGAKVVAGAINAGLQRTKDFYQFLSENGNKQDSDLAFNRMYPVARYVQEAQALAKIPSVAIDTIQKYDSDPRALTAFDAAFGSGMHRYFTGQ